MGVTFLSLLMTEIKLTVLLQIELSRRRQKVAAILLSLAVPVGIGLLLDLVDAHLERTQALRIVLEPRCCPSTWRICSIRMR